MREKNKNFSKEKSNHINSNGVFSIYRAASEMLSHNPRINMNVWDHRLSWDNKIFFRIKSKHANDIDGDKENWK